MAGKMVAAGDLGGNDEERERILPGPSGLNPRGGSEVIAVQENEDEPSSRNETGFSDADAIPLGCCGELRRSFEMFLARIRLCPCLFYECLGKERICRICQPRKLERYEKLEEEFFYAEYGQDIRTKCKTSIIKFYYHSEAREFFPLLVVPNMTAFSAVKMIAANVNTRDFYRYSIMEYWREFEAERMVEDHELILYVRNVQLSSRQHFFFVYTRDLDKYDYIIHKRLYFINPQEIRARNAVIKQTDDPMLIQVLDPYFARPYKSLLTSRPLAGANDEDTPPRRNDAMVDYAMIEFSSQQSAQGPVTTDPTPHEPQEQISSRGLDLTDQHPVASDSAPEELQEEASPKVLVHASARSPSKIHGHDESEAVSSDEEKPQATPVVGSPKKKQTQSTSAESVQERPPSPDIQVLPCDDPPIPVPDNELVNPIFCGTIFIKPLDVRCLNVAEAKRLPGEREKVKWIKKFMLLRDRKLYFVIDHETMLKFYFMEDDKFAATVNKRMKSKKETEMLKLIGPVADYDVYTTVKGMRHHNAPHGGAMYLRQRNLKRPMKLMFCAMPRDNINYAYHAPDRYSEGKNMWLTALRLAKHGVKLKEGFSGYNVNKTDFQSIIEEGNDPRVPMDFTEGTGRIVVDEAELAEIRRNPREWARVDRFEMYEMGPIDILKEGRHMTQQYYHGELNRMAAEVMLVKENIEGAWLLRSSRMRGHCLTLSYLHEARVHNKYVFAAPHEDLSSGKHIYVITLDKKLAFYDVHSLTEFYRLNYSDVLKCMLTKSIKNENQRDCSPPRRIAPRVVPIGPIDLAAASFNYPVEGNKSPRSLRGFLSKSFQKSKQALMPKKLAVGGTSLELSAPSTSKEPETIEPPPKQLESLVSPPSSLQEPTSSGISSIEEPSSPTSPLTQDEAPVAPPSELEASAKAPEA